MNHRSAEEKQGKVIIQIDHKILSSRHKSSDRIHVSPKSGIFIESD